MKINKELSIALTVSELTEIIIDHFKTKGYDIDRVNYNVDAYEEPGDYNSSFPLSHRLSNVVCVGTEEQLNKN